MGQFDRLYNKYRVDENLSEALDRMIDSFSPSSLGAVNKTAPELDPFVVGADNLAALDDSAPPLCKFGPGGDFTTDYTPSLTGGRVARPVLIDRGRR